MKNSRRIVALFAACVLLLVLLSACRPEPVAPGEGQVIVLAPSAGETINSDTVTVNVFVDNFKLVDPSGQPNQYGQGHIIYYLDVTPPLDKSHTALTADGTFAVSAQRTYVWSQISPGFHNFWVQLVNNDNTPLEPAAAVRVPVIVLR